VRRKENAVPRSGSCPGYKLPASTTEGELLGIVEDLNRDPAIHGILVQLPLPGSIRTATVLERIDPRKDVDGFTPVNVGRLFTGDSFHVACTPQGILALLDRTGIEIAGKEAVVVGRSNIVGKPLACCS
jgi:methylenetetrahydrofolate dehydrogenase (NADP+)/methenyltetrahydrofolate cyclohydrolase